MAKTNAVPVVETKVENEAKKTEVLTAPLPVVPVIQTEDDAEPVLPPVKIKKKKVPNETPAERLRNAEKILTGV